MTNDVVVRSVQSARFAAYVAAMFITALALASAARRGPDELPYFMDASFTPRFIARGSWVLGLVPRVGKFAPTDPHSGRVTEADMAGRVAVLTFFDAHCGKVCLAVRARLRSLASRFAADRRVLVLPQTLAPASDSVAGTARVLLVDRLGRVRGVYDGTLAFELEHLEADLDLLLAKGNEP